MVAALLSSRRFLPLFVAQFLGAMNDNVFKNAMAVLLLWRAGDAGPLLVVAAGGVFILPYALFSSLAGQLADAHEMVGLIRKIKMFEIGLMALGAIGFATADPVTLMLVLFGLGVHSTFFGPIKYAILPLHLVHAELVTGNGLIEAGTFLAILIGTIMGGGLILGPAGPWLVSGCAVAAAVLGYGAARAIPAAPAATPGLRLDWNIWRGTRAILAIGRANRPVWRAILAISWFWTVGATVLSQFPVMAKDELRADSGVVTLFLAVFSIGIGAGSMLEARLLRGEVSLRHAPWASAGISLFLLDFVMGSAGVRAEGVAALLSQPAGWRILVDLFALALCGGMFSVPLYALMQERSDVAVRSRIIADNNVMNALFMVAGAAVAAGLTALGLHAPAILIVTAIANGGVAVVILQAGRARWER